MAGRQLKLTNRANFFTDPAFADLVNNDDADLRKRLDLFKSRALSVAGKDTEPHNLQITVSNDRYLVQLELPGFSPEDFALKSKGDAIILEAKHQGKAGDDEVTSRSYTKEFKIPEGVQVDKISSSYSAGGILTVEAPRVITAPEGASVQEAMAAKSKAYTTDDGKTAVKEDSSASSQVIAATTESPDGRTKSSMSYSSSNSSSSSTMTSSSGALGTMPSMPEFPSMGGGGGNMGSLSMDMDGMMKKMMADMSMGGPGGSEMPSLASKMGATDMAKGMMKSSFSSSSTSSSSMQSSSTKSSSTMGGIPGRGQDALLDMMGPGLDIEEMSNAGSDIGGPPGYTVTSPPPSTRDPTSPVPSAADLLTHSVKPAPDYKELNGDPQADHTVLLKVREGDEYKLLLNMQSYRPENITVKLSDERELSITALAGDKSEDFCQRHVVPAGIDTDSMTSAFTEDGMLVIRAPRIKKK